jgi:hypothetical protein
MIIPIKAKDTESKPKTPPGMKVNSSSKELTMFLIKIYLQEKLKGFLILV